MNRGRGILVCVCVALLALVGARAGLGGIGTAGLPVPVQGGAAPLFSGVQLAPGLVVVRSASVSNGGDAPGRFSLSATAEGDLARVLDVTVSDASGRVLYHGSLARFDVSVGVLQPGESRSVRIAAALPEDAASSTAGLVAGASFTWTGTAN